MIDLFLDRYVYLLVLVLLAIGLYGVLAKGDLAKKVIGMTIFTTAIYLFFIEGSLQIGGSAPIIDEAFGSDADAYVDPLPHLLILTAIVVGVGVVGVALSLLVRIHRAHGTLDEAVVADRLSGVARPVGEPGTDQGRGPGDRDRVVHPSERDDEPDAPRGRGPGGRRGDDRGGS